MSAVLTENFRFVEDYLMYLKLVRPTCEYAEQVMEYKEDIPTCLLLFLGCMILTISCIIVTLTNEKKYRDKKDDKE